MQICRNRDRLPATSTATAEEIRIVVATHFKLPEPAYIQPYATAFEAIEHTTKLITNTQQHTTKRVRLRSGAQTMISGMPRGANTRKLTADNVVAIRARYAKGDIAMAALGTEFGVNKSTVHDIVTGKSYRWVDKPEPARYFGPGIRPQKPAEPVTEPASTPMRPRHAGGTQPATTRTEELEPWLKLRLAKAAAAPDWYQAPATPNTNKPRRRHVGL